MRQRAKTELAMDRQGASAARGRPCDLDQILVGTDESRVKVQPEGLCHPAAVEELKQITLALEFDVPVFASEPHLNDLGD